MSKPFGSVWSLRTGAASRMDAAGNRTGVNGQGYQVGPGNQMTNDGTYSYHYDNEGNLIQRVTVAGGNTRDFTYDHRNRLTEVVDHLGSDAGPVTQDLKYDYDVFDRPVSRTLNVAGGAQTIERYSYDGDHVVLDWLDPDGSGPAPFALQTRYLYGPAVDRILAQEDVTQLVTAPNRVLWFLGDNQGTTRDLAYNTGVPAAHYTYDVFGQVLSGDTSLTQYLYTAREYDAATGLQYNRERWYDPHTGRWISQDPIGLAADANPYRYVGNDPTNTMDPSRLGPSTQKIAVRHYRSFAIHLKSASLRRERTGRGSN